MAWPKPRNMCHMDTTRVHAELNLLRDFIDFVNRQVGVYCDCVSGFQGNKVRIERQAARINRPVSKRIENGRPVIVWASVEDPTQPDVLHHRITRMDEFIDVNSEGRFNEQQVCWAIVVFIFAYWDEELRPQIAKTRGVQPNNVQVDALGDLRILRKSIVHNGGVITASDHRKLTVLSGICKPDSKLSLTHADMHAVFVAIKNAIGRLILVYTGHLAGTPKPDPLTKAGFAHSRTPLSAQYQTASPYFLHSPPRPPQTAAASFKSRYRKSSAICIRLLPLHVSPRTSDQR